jgi:membrane protein
MRSQNVTTADDVHAPPPPSLGTTALLIAAGIAAEMFLPRRGGELSAVQPEIDLVPPPRKSTREIADAEPARDKSPATLFKIAKNVVVRIGKDNLSLVAAGVAFYAMTAIFPAIAAFVSIYGLFADPAKVQDQVASLSSLLPATSLKLLTDALQSYASKSHSSLNFALLVALALALWSAKAGVSAMMTGLNIANEQEEKRGFILQQVIAIALTVGAVLFAMVALTALAVLPALIGFLPLTDRLKTALDLGRWPLLAVLVGFALAVAYRFGAYKEHPKWRWISWGAAIATVLWIIGSALFSFYVSRFGSYDATYGSLAAPVVLLLWFWLSALIVLIGSEIDAELEHSDSGEVRPTPQGSP